MSDTNEVKEEVRILLIGRTGHGKSSVGNTILGSDVFEVSYGSKSCTDTCQYGERDEGSVRIVVTDTPGVFDTNIPQMELMKELMKSVVYTHPGFHVIAFVLRPDRFTKELQETKKLFFDWFGENVKDYFCVIFTHSSGDEDVEKYTANPHPVLSDLLYDCGGTVIPFDNSASSSLKERQVRNFLSHVHEIKRRNNGYHFYNMAYHIANEYRNNRDMSTVSLDSIRILQDAGIDITKGVDKLTETLTVEGKRNASGGNLRIFYDNPGQSDEPVVGRRSHESHISSDSVRVIDNNGDIDLQSDDGKGVITCASDTYTSPGSSMHSHRHSAETGSGEDKTDPQTSSVAVSVPAQTKMKTSRPGRVQIHTTEPIKATPEKRPLSRRNRKVVSTPIHEVDHYNQEVLKTELTQPPWPYASGDHGHSARGTSLPRDDPEANRQFRENARTENLIEKIIQAFRRFINAIRNFIPNMRN